MLDAPQGQKLVSFDAVITRADGTVHDLGLIDHSHAWLFSEKELADLCHAAEHLENLLALRAAKEPGAVIIPTGSASIASGKAVYAGLAEGSGQVVPSFIGFGQGNPAGTRITALVTDLGLAGELAAPGGTNTNTGQTQRVGGVASLVTTTNLNDTFQVVGTITAGTALQIVEAALLDTQPYPGQAVLATQGVFSGTGTGTFTVVSASGIPTASSNWQIEQEVFTATSSGTTVTITARGVNGSTAVSHANGSSITVVTAGGTGAGGKAAAKGDFAVINLATNDSLQLTAKVQFT